MACEKHEYGCAYESKHFTGAWNAITTEQAFPGPEKEAFVSGKTHLHCIAWRAA